MFGEVLEGTEALVHYKKHRFKKGPEFAFFMVFVKKIKIFPSFCFNVKWINKSVWCSSRKKKTPFKTKKH